MRWLFAAFWNYATFSGRARRKEYYGFHLTQLTILLICLFLDSPAFENVTYQPSDFTFSLSWLALTILPSIAVTIRRLHDINRSGWWFLVLAIPFVGPVVFIVMTLLCGTRGRNQYGYDPRNLFSNSF